jgi:8-oxo-dGTP diphosphatase
MKFTENEENLSKYTIAVSAYITNEKGEVLLVKSIGREDTWELPGGRVEAGETLLEAILREVKEEANAEVTITSQVGIYQNPSRNLLIVTFLGKYLSGEIRPQEGEIVSASFQKLDHSNIDSWITRQHIKNRVIDAMDGKVGVLEIVSYEPYELISKMGGTIT